MASEEIRSQEREPLSPQPGGAMRDFAAVVETVPSANFTSALTEDQALAVLLHRDLPPDTIEQFSQNSGLMKSRKVRGALAAHPRMPRHVALRLIRQFYTFDLMQFALQPGTAADLKRVADEQLVTRLASVTLGERLTLARRASGAVAAVLLLDKESRVSHTALDNSRLTEAAVCHALMRPSASAALVEAVCHHPKWSLRREIQLTLLRNPHTPLPRALSFARALPPPLLRDVLHTSHLPERIKAYLRNDLEKKI